MSKDTRSDSGKGHCRHRGWCVRFGCEFDHPSWRKPECPDGYRCTLADQGHVNTTLHPKDTADKLQDKVDRERLLCGSAGTRGSRITTVADVAGFKGHSGFLEDGSLSEQIDKYIRKHIADAPPHVLSISASEFVQERIARFTKQATTLMVNGEDPTSLLLIIKERRAEAMKEYKQQVGNRVEARQTYLREAVVSLEEVICLAQNSKGRIEEELERGSAPFSMADAVAQKGVSDGGGAASSSTLETESVIE